LAALLLFLAPLLISFEMNEVKRLVFNKPAFWLMVLASFLTSLSFLFFKYFALEASLLTTAFWEYVGFSLTAVALFVFIPVYRKQFLKVLKENKASVL
jgi:Na+-transporting NADH:ubiquinone oxidoreductase subunit NqrB